MRTLIKLLSACDSARADKESNGYYIVTEKWNTCFFRWAKNITDRIEVRVNSNPKVAHSYTRIPSILKDKVYFIYVNTQEGFKILLKEDDIIIGGYEPQPSGEYLNYSFLIYSPTGSHPDVKRFDEPGAWVKGKRFNMDMLCPSGMHVRSFNIKN